MDERLQRLKQLVELRRDADLATVARLQASDQNLQTEIATLREESTSGGSVSEMNFARHAEVRRRWLVGRIEQLNQKRTELWSELEDAQNRARRSLAQSSVIERLIVREQK